MWWAGWVLGCRQDEAGTVAPCEEAVLAHSATEVGLRVGGRACGELLLQDFQVVGSGDFVLDLFSDGDRLMPKITATQDGSVLRGLRASGEVGLAGRWPLAVWRLGQSADASRVTEPAALEIDTDGLPAGPGWSWGAMAAGRGDGASVLLGAHGLPGADEDLLGTLALGVSEDERIEVAWMLDDRPLPEGSSVYLAPLFAALGPDPALLWSEWTQRAGFPPLSARPVPEPGWVISPGEDEASVEAALSAAEGALGLVLLEVRERQPGDWQASAQFPSGRAALAARIEAAGATPGLAWSPLVAEPGSPVHEQHPDWWIQDDLGDAFLQDGLLALDLRQEPALDWIEQQMQQLWAEGWRYQRLDRLEVGIISGLPAYRAALGRLRSAAPGVWLVAGEGAPLLPSVASIDAVSIASEAVGDEWEILHALSFGQGRGWWLEPGPLSSIAEPGETSLRWTLGALTGAGPRWAGSAGEVGQAISLPPSPPGPEEIFPSSPLAPSLGPVPVRWDAGELLGLVNLGETPVTIDGPGGEELWSGRASEPGPRTLPSRTAELWR